MSDLITAIYALAASVFVGWRLWEEHRHTGRDVNMLMGLAFSPILFPVFLFAWCFSFVVGEKDWQ